MKDDVCTIEGCEKKQFARGWCSAHYNRWHRGKVDDGPYYLDLIREKFVVVRSVRTCPREKARRAVFLLEPRHRFQDSEAVYCYRCDLLVGEELPKHLRSRRGPLGIREELLEESISEAEFADLYVYGLEGGLEWNTLSTSRRGSEKSSLDPQLATSR